MQQLGLLKCLNRHLEDDPDSVYIRWAGMIYREEDLFVRLDKLFMYLVYIEPATQEPTLRRMVGYNCKNARREEPQVIYTTAPMYRVMGGARNGRIMPLAHTFEHEATETAGVYKVLNINEGRRALHPSTKNDGYLISLLEELCPDPGDKIEAIDLGKQRAFPKLYLSCQYNNSALYSRMAGYKWLNENTNITQSASANGSLKQLMSLGVNAGENRIAYPYEYMYGRGVVVADTGMLGKWYKTTLLDLLSGEQPDVRFQQEVIE